MSDTSDERDRGLDRHGDPDPSKWEEAEAVTDRPNDTPLRGEDEPAVPNSTLADRAKARGSEGKQVSEAEDKSVGSAETKRARRATKKS